MTAYIQDKNNAEDIENDVTVLNATNYGNLTYKVDELQFVLNKLHNYKHTTIIASIKDSWESKSWAGIDSGVVSEDATNYIMNGKSVKLTGDADEDGIHLSKVMDLTTHADGYASSTDDIITLFIYVSSGDLSNITHLDIGFYNEVFGTWDNYFWYRFEHLLKAGKNIVKLKKSDFDEYGSPDWSAIRGIDVYLEDAPSAEVSVSLDMILLHTQEFKNFIYKTTQEDVTNNATLQDDDELYVTLPQNGIFEIDLNLAVNATDTSTDIKCAWSTSGDIALMGRRFYQSHNTNVTDVNNSSTVKIGCYDDITTALAFGVVSGDPPATYIHEKFIVLTLNDGGTLQFRWAQQSAQSGKTTAIKVGSYMKITQLQ
jgi:hypothetical protein